MKKGNKLTCLNTVNNLFGQPLFEKGKEYEVLYVDNESVQVMICLKHILYANEYNSFPLEWVNKNFANI